MGSMSKAGFSSDEESGWTTYFDDFFNNHKSSSISSFVSSSSSLVSDATSFNLAAKKVTHSDDDDDDRTRDEEFSVNENAVSCRKSNFRKRKKLQEINNLVIHDVLQDTATSPLKKKGCRSSNRKETGSKRAGRHTT